MKPARIFVGPVDGLGPRLMAMPGLRSGRAEADFHGRDASSLWLLWEGNALLDIGVGQIALPRRRLCLIRDAAVSVQLDGKAGLVGLAFPSAALDEQLRGKSPFGGARRRMLMPEVGMPGRAACRALHRQLRGLQAGVPAPAIESVLNELLLGLAIDQQKRHAELLERSPGRTCLERARSLRRLMLARCVLQMEGGERVSISQLAELACYSASQFVRTFSAVFQTTPGELRHRLRLSRAKHLLAGTRLSVDEVAAEVGYENRSAFARMFRAGTGMSASQYRIARALPASMPRIAYGRVHGVGRASIRSGQE